MMLSQGIHSRQSPLAIRKDIPTVPHKEVRAALIDNQKGRRKYLASFQNLLTVREMCV